MYLTFGTDAQGGAYADAQVLNDLHAKANAPMFGSLSSYFGRGIVGGSMMSIEELARNTTDVAIRILNGEPPASLKVPPQLPSQPRFDWRELQRWGIRSRSFLLVQTSSIGQQAFGKPIVGTSPR